ncbi:MAG: ferredoxin-thioredoxin reductase catalytic domain-containing protein [Spirochaetales bacterium]|uniref:ferredoxin:thioredoxin reductase n=1 Tax=Candidatus Thalassospirochaeta sargassi TaxID=3119039 RepID=A0AAJ1ML61_9SPIO|nr:ferredoxin-thioredoxin reductase catalytic domain-containing protein [Spirochaetales bacterium]
MAAKKLNLDDVAAFTKKAAEKNGWVLNPDSDFRESVEEGLYNNYLQYGYLICPCREAWGEKDKDRDVVCPCDYCADDVKEFGHCYCGLYMSAEFVASGEEPGSIPERRSPELTPE